MIYTLLFDALDKRLDYLATLLPFQDNLELTRSLIKFAAGVSGRLPGVVTNEDDGIEARWVVRRTPDFPKRIINVSFGEMVDLYVFDSSTQTVIFEMSYDPDSPFVGELIGCVIKEAIEGVSSEMEWKEYSVEYMKSGFTHSTPRGSLAAALKDYNEIPGYSQLNGPISDLRILVHRFTHTVEEYQL